MNPELRPDESLAAPAPAASAAAAASAPVAPAPTPPSAASLINLSDAGLRRALVVLALLALGGVAGSFLVWQKLSNVQQQLARQSADSGAQATQARATAAQAEDLAMQTAAKLAVTEAKLSEVALQRTQLEELMQSLSRSRDENLVVDIESSVRLAQQQTQLTGSIEPLLASLKSADQRVTRASQPRLAQLQRAIARDIGRIKSTALSDTPALLIRIDELVTLVDQLPVANSVGNVGNLGNVQLDPAANPPHTAAPARQPEQKVASWSTQVFNALRDEFRSLVRVSRVENPDAALLSPEQSFFVRENLKLRLLNARLGLLSRQIDSSRADLNMAAQVLGRYFDTSSRKTQTAINLLQQIQSQMRTLEIPRIDDTLAALATAAAGR